MRETEADPAVRLSVPPLEVRVDEQEVTELSEALTTSDGSKGDLPAEVKGSELERFDTVPETAVSGNSSSDSLDSHEGKNPDLPPRRSARETRPPAWVQSGDYVMKMSQGQRVAENLEPEWLMKANYLKDLAQQPLFANLQGNLGEAILKVVVGSLNG